MNDLRILHWNVHMWTDQEGKSNAPLVTRLIRRHLPDVVSLVEVEEQPGTGPLDKLAETCSYRSVFCPAFEFGTPETHGAFGNAILTRLPLRAVRHWQLLWPVPAYDGTEPSEARTVTFAGLQTDKGILWAGTTHLPRSDEQARNAALRRLMTLAGNLRAPWVIAGDYNAAHTWAAYCRVVTAPSCSVPTHPADAPSEPIDYIVAAPGLEVSAEILTEPGSDHLPVLATARIS